MDTRRENRGESAPAPAAAPPRPRTLLRRTQPNVAWQEADISSQWAPLDDLTCQIYFVRLKEACLCQNGVVDWLPSFANRQIRYKAKNRALLDRADPLRL